MDYLKFFELQKEPFRSDPDRDFFFESKGQRGARMRLLRGVQQRKGLCVLIGAPGCGKTTLALRLVEELRSEPWVVRLMSIPHVSCSSGWLLPTVAKVFGVTKIAASPPAILEQIHEALCAAAKRGEHPVLIADEAQLLDTAEVMEEFRSLLNLLHEDRKLLSIVLIGLPELAEILSLDEPLAQRIEIRVELGTLSDQESAAYLAHRLRCAGAAEGPFTVDAISAISSCASGIPRLMNALADNTLFEAFMSEAKPADSSLVLAAAEALDLTPPGSSSEEPPEWVEGLVPPAQMDLRPERALPLERDADSESAAELELEPEPSSPAAEPEIEVELPVAEEPSVVEDATEEASTAGEGGLEELSASAVVLGLQIDVRDEDIPAEAPDVPEPTAGPSQPVDGELSFGSGGFPTQLGGESGFNLGNALREMDEELSASRMAHAASPADASGEPAQPEPEATDSSNEDSFVGGDTSSVDLRTLIDEFDNDEPPEVVDPRPGPTAEEKDEELELEELAEDEGDDLQLIDSLFDNIQSSS